MMNATVEQLCDKIAERRLIADADLTRMKARWFRPGRADVNDVEKFAHWLTVNGYLTEFAVRMLRSGKADLLRLNQYQLLDHLTSGPFAGAYLAVDPLGRHVVLEVLGTERAAKPEAVQAFHVAAEKARSVQHPNINLTIDFGEAHGRHYLVREFDEGETVAEVLIRRGRMKPITAARLFSLAMVGLQALHEKQVAAGPLGADSILLSVASKANRKARNVKILNAGVPRSQFDPSALDPAATAAPATNNGAAGAADPPEELFRLGATFYRSLTGQLPFPAETTGANAPHAMPIRQIAPDVPEMLAQLVESMIDPEPLQRPRGAAQAAKSLRVLLASEEEAAAAQPEEEFVPHPAAPAPVPVPQPEPEQPAHAAASAGAEEQPAQQGAVAEQFKKLWEELAPSQRDWVFLGIGAAAVVLLVLFLTLVTGIRFVNVVCLLTGGALSFLVERMLRLREGQPE